MAVSNVCSNVYLRTLEAIFFLQIGSFGPVGFGDIGMLLLSICPFNENRRNMQFQAKQKWIYTVF